MPLPAGWTLIDVTGTFLNLDGSPASGQIDFISGQVVVIDDIIVVPKRITVSLDDDGAFAVQLPSTDDPELSVGGWTYTVRERIAGGRDPYAIFVEYDGGPIDLASVSPVVEVPVQAGLATSVQLQALEERVEDLEEAPGGGAFADITGAPDDNAALAAALDAHQAAAQAHAVQRANHTGGQDAATITSGTIDIARLPAGALEKLVTVADQAARFALTTATVQLGDTVKQTDTGLLYYVVDEANLGNAAGYVEYTAGAASSVPWSGVSSKPQIVTDIAAVTGSDDDVLQKISGTWVSRTMAQLKTKLAIVAADISNFASTVATLAAASAAVLTTPRTIGGISFDGSADIEPGVSTVSVTTGRALALTDRNKQIHQTHASPQTISIPAQSSVTWVDPTTIIILAHGAGTCTLDADPGVTLNGVSGGSVALNRYQNAVLRWISSDVWVVSGTSADVA